MTDHLWRVEWGLDDVPRIDDRVVLNTAPLQVPCDICTAKPGDLCQLADAPGPGIPIMFHHGRVLAAEAAGFGNDCNDVRRAAMKMDADAAGGISVGWSLGRIGWLDGREQVYDPEDKLGRLKKELEAFDGP